MERARLAGRRPAPRDHWSLRWGQLEDLLGWVVKDGAQGFTVERRRPPAPLADDEAD